MKTYEETTGNQNGRKGKAGGPFKKGTGFAFGNQGGRKGNAGAPFKKGTG